MMQVAAAGGEAWKGLAVPLDSPHLQRKTKNNRWAGWLVGAWLDQAGWLAGFRLDGWGWACLRGKEG